MYCYEETINGRKLTEIINTDHENVKYLPGYKLPENVVRLFSYITPVGVSLPSKEVGLLPSKEFEAPWLRIDNTRFSVPEQIFEISWEKSLRCSRSLVRGNLIPPLDFTAHSDSVDSLSLLLKFYTYFKPWLMWKTPDWKLGHDSLLLSKLLRLN